MGSFRMDFLRVALLQMVSTSSPEGNLRKGEAFCRQAKEMGADIALFPEMWNIGYQIDPDPERLRQHAVPRDGEFVAFFGRLAKTLSMAIGITFLEAYEPLPRNTLCLFDREGTAS